MDAFVSSGGVWKKVTSVFVSSGGVWKKVNSAWTSSSGVWKQWFTGALSPTIATTVAISTNSATYPATLTGTNYRWTNSTSLSYGFQSSTNNASWTTVSSGTATNPAIGSSNTNTYAPGSGIFTAAIMYFRYFVTGSNSTYGTSFTSTSGSTSMRFPAPTINTGSWSGTYTTSGSATYFVGATANATSTATYIYRSDGTAKVLGGTALSYNITFGAGDAGYYFYGYTVATGIGGSTTSGTANSSTVATPPTAAQGTFGGGTERDQMITYTPGTTTNANISVTSYLIRADASNTYLASASGTSSVLYILTAADVGYQLYGYTTAVGSGGSATSSARFSSYITAPPPPTAGTGSWSGTAAVGNTITYTRGASTNATSTVIQMFRSDGAQFVSSGTATSYSYTVQTTDQGYYFYAYSVATGAGGTATSATSSTGTVPTVGVAPSLPGLPVGTNDGLPTGGTFRWTASTTGTAPITYNWSMYRNGSFYNSGSGTYLQIATTATGSFYLTLYASNAYGFSGTRTSGTVTFT